MKILKTMPVLLLAAFMTTSCGSDNSSGGGGNNNSGSTNGAVTVSGTAYGSIEEVRNRMQSISFASGIAANTEIVHAGSRYAQNQGGGSTTILGFLEFNWNTSSGSSYRALRVNSAAQDSVNVTRSTGSNYSGFTYDGGVAQELNRSSTDYREMLSLDGECTQTQVTEVMITTQVYSGNNAGGSQSIKGNQILCLRSNGQVRVSVVSDALPVAANPIYIQEGGSTGYLVKVGDRYINGIQ